MAKETLPVAKVECEKFSLDHVKIGKENKKLDIFVFAKIKDSVYTQEDNRKYLFESEICDERYKNQTFIENKCLKIGSDLHGSQVPSLTLRWTWD